MAIDLLRLLLLCSFATLVNSQSESFGWIVAGTNPLCSYCLNVILADPQAQDYTSLPVGIYRCLKYDSNELWNIDDATNTIRVVDPQGHVLCLDAGFESSYGGLNVSFLPFQARACDGSARQQWFFDSGTSSVRSGLMDEQGGAVYMVSGDLPGTSQAHETAAYYNLYLSSLQAPGSVNSNFTFHVSSSYSGLSLQEKKVVGNGGFERSTVLANWPPGNDCSSFTAACSKQMFFTGELFSLCSWAIGDASNLRRFRNRGSTWRPAEGNYSLLLGNGASIQQTIRTEANSKYLLTFSLAGFLSPSPDSDTYQLCSGNPAGWVEVQAGSKDLFTRSFRVGEPSKDGHTIWSTEVLPFTATGSTVLVVFTTAGFWDIRDNSTRMATPCGPVIDNVSVTILPTSKESASSKMVKGVAGGAAAALVLLLLVALVLVWKRQRQARTALYLSPKAVQTVKVFSLNQIRRATNNWSTVVGRGGFSTVFKTVFPDGVVGAAKVEECKASRRPLFSKEVSLLQRVNHRNLVNLIGFCAEKGERILVFEFLPNGNLDKRLHGPVEEPVLSWYARTKIVYQVACALEYLHHGSSPPIVHRDIKSANILLTATDSAKLADFGLSKSAPLDASAFQSVQTNVKGSLGYLDPRYIRSGVYSIKSDVYSFGVVLLEIVTGHPAIKDLELLANWANDYLNDPFLAHEMVDKRLLGDFDEADLHILVDLVKLCLQEDPQLRPSMLQVISFLADSQFSGFPPSSAVAVPQVLHRHSRQPEPPAETSPVSPPVPSC